MAIPKAKTSRISKLIQMPYEKRDLYELIKDDMTLKFRSLASNTFEFYNTNDSLEVAKGFKSIHQSGFSNRKPLLSKVRLNKVEMKILNQTENKEKLMSEMFSIFLSYKKLRASIPPGGYVFSEVFIGLWQKPSKTKITKFELFGIFL